MKLRPPVGGTGSTTADNLPGATPTGKTLMKASSASVARANLGAAAADDVATIETRSINAMTATTRPNGDRIVYVSTAGSDANGGRSLGLPFLTIGAALAALGTSAGLVSVSGGTYSFSSTLSLRNGQRIDGAGRYNTFLTYTGTGTAIDIAVPDTRIYGVDLSDFTLNTTTGAVGVDLDSVSLATYSNLIVRGFSDAQIRMRSVVPGGAVYLTFTHVHVLGKGAASASIGFDIQASGSNSNNFYGCSARSAGIGLKITDSNQTVWSGGTFEVDGIGVQINSTTANLGDGNTIIGARFEGQTVYNWDITGPNVRDTMIVYPMETTLPGNRDLGTTTNIETTRSSYSRRSSRSTAAAAGSFRFERTANGGAEMPCFVVSDTATSSGTPVTLQVETERSTGYAIRTKRAGTTYFDVDAQGNVRQPAGSYFELTERADPAAPATNNVRLYARDNGSGNTQLVARFPTGDVQSIALEGAAAVAPSSGNPGAWVAADNGLLACDVDPMLSSTSFTPTPGVLYLRKMKMGTSSAVSNILFYVNTAGASVSNAYAGVYDAGGTLLASTTDSSTSFQAVNTKTLALTAPTAVIPAGTWVYVAFLIGAATTAPNLRGHSQSVHFFGVAGTPAAFRWASTGTGLTALPASFTPTTVSSVAGVSVMTGLS